MSNKRKYHIVIGSKSFFDEKISVCVDEEDTSDFLELVKLSDAAKQNKQIFDEWADRLILKNNNYHGIVDTAHDRLGPLIEDLTYDNAEIYVHNPPRVLHEYLEDQFMRGLIEMDVEKQVYGIEKDANSFGEKMNKISKNIIGQAMAIEEVTKSMWYLTTVERKKPYVIMLYGNSSLGKTELVREISKHFFEGKYLEKHLSMFKNNFYADYMFGDAPNRRCIGFDLLERESNLLFLDEVDKCPEHFYSAFYTLFDNTMFKDATYDTDVSGLVIILTSNFHNQEEMKNQLGMPIFYRIDKFIKFEDFDCDSIYLIVRKEIETRKEEFESKLTTEDVYSAVAPLISASGENARTIKNKVQHVIEELLFQDVLKKD